MSEIPSSIFSIVSFIYFYQILFIAMSIFYMCLIPIMKHTSVDACITQGVTKQAF